MQLGYTKVGTGSVRVLAAHTWLCDHQTYAPMIPFIDGDRFTLVFPDFRGYGKSKNLQGVFTVREMGRDLLSLAAALGWREYHLVGNSMGGQAAQWAVGQKTGADIRSLTLLCSVPAHGFPLDEQTGAFFASAVTDPQVRGQCATAVTGGRLGTGFAKHIVECSRATATDGALAKYLKAWTTEDVSAETGSYRGPVSVFVGEHDPVLTAEVMEQKVLPLFPQARISTIQGAGHYPGLEQPAYTAELLASVASAA